LTPQSPFTATPRATHDRSSDALIGPQAQPPDAPAVPWLWIAAIGFGLTGCGTPEAPVNPAVPKLPVTAEEADYVGSAACADCHETEWSAWAKSDHHKAIQQPTKATVLGDFHGVPVAAGHPERPVLNTDGSFSVHRSTKGHPPKSYPVRYTFGHSPLQQYLLDVGNGRLQAWSWAWDSRPNEAGGQRWFSLHGEREPLSDSPMHWSGRGFNWNSQCADCHSTGVQKHYDPATDAYTTQFEELSVGCEACHGPASHHLTWATNPSGTDRGVLGLSQQSTEINACAPCHSRRVQLAEGFQPDTPFLDHYAPALLEEGLYHSDGQINEEVYVYGSFLQSKMHRQGVRCSHCHEPHGGTLRHRGNSLCTQCHSPAGRADFPTLNPGDYDHPAHTLHAEGSPGAQCVSCHMPETTYMGVDPRRDHGFHLPRPHRSEGIGAPNPCESCHSDRDAAWSKAAIEKHHKPAPTAHFATVIDQGRKGIAAAEPQLARLATDPERPVMIRATAASLLERFGGAPSREALEVLTRDSEPLVRLGAAVALGGLQPADRWRLGAPLLTDTHRAVRLQSFEGLLPALNPDHQPPDAFRTVMAEYLQAQALQAEHPESHTNLGLLHTATGDLTAAQAAYDRALERQSDWTPALINSAELARARGDGERERALMDRALEASPENAEVNYAKALWMTRQKQPKDAVRFYANARDLAPDEAHYWYALGLAHLGDGNAPAAIEELEQAVQRWPAMPQLRQVLINEYLQAAKAPRALLHAEALVKHHPGDPRYIQQLQQIRRRQAPSESSPP
jgi:predicted CXXCH cytochrome family protein